MIGTARDEWFSPGEGEGEPSPVPLIQLIGWRLYNQYFRNVSSNAQEYEIELDGDLSLIAYFANLELRYWRPNNGFLPEPEDGLVLPLRNLRINERPSLASFVGARGEEEVGNHLPSSTAQYENDYSTQSEHERRVSNHDESAERVENEQRSPQSISTVKIVRRSTNRSAKKINTGQGPIKSDHTPSTTGFCEIDNRCDTVSMGKNARALILTGQTCEVRGFHNDLGGIADVEVATCATAWIDPKTGFTYILIFHEALYFGPSLDHSLINPNQLRHFGTPVWDNPYDTDHPMGIDLDTVFIPFDSQGATIYFETHCPTDRELEECPHIIMTSDREWDPHNVSLNKSTPTRFVEECSRTIAQASRDIEMG
ncbi:MAG: hypothetical protein GWN14_03225, partial [candidate division Zixibacteria bacterium]|nr:hypothetical protein [candidate division Zixibacteria bacterium]